MTGIGPRRNGRVHVAGAGARRSRRPSCRTSSAWASCSTRWSSGVSPFRRETAAETMTAILREDPPELAGRAWRVPCPSPRPAVTASRRIRGSIPERARSRCSPSKLAIGLHTCRRQLSAARRRFSRRIALALAGAGVLSLVRSPGSFSGSGRQLRRSATRGHRASTG